MANTDRPNGFTPVKTLSGAPWQSLIKTIGMGNGEDLFVGDAINLATGLALVADTADTALLGVAVGFGKFDPGGTIPQGPFNPDSLTTLFYDDSASTHTEWCCYYVPFDDVVFEAQTATALTLVVGATCDLLGTGGDEATGRSRQEITTSSNAEFTVVQLPNIADHASTTGFNITTEVWGRYWVMATRAAQAFHG